MASDLKYYHGDTNLYDNPDSLNDSTLKYGSCQLYVKKIVKLGFSRMVFLRMVFSRMVFSRMVWQLYKSEAMPPGF